MRRVDINVNGQTYSRWDDVPPEVRQKLAAALPDADRNGVPDLFETGALPPGAVVGTAVVVNGQPVSSLDQLPPQVRERLHQVFGWAPPAPGVPAPTSTPPAATPPAATTPASTPPAPPSLAPGQVMLNGVPTTVGGATEPTRSWWRRLLRG